MVHVGHVEVGQIDGDLCPSIFRNHPAHCPAVFKGAPLHDHLAVQLLRVLTKESDFICEAGAVFFQVLVQSIAGIEDFPRQIGGPLSL